MKTTFCISGCLLAFASLASASVVLTFQGGTLRDSASNAIIDGSTVAVFADNDGLNGALPSSSSLIGQNLVQGTSYDGNELISLFSASSLVTGSAGGFNNQETIIFDNGLVSGTNLILVWFPNYTNLGPALAEGQEFGTFRTEVVDGSSGGDQGYSLPNDDGSRKSVFYFDESLAGSSSVAKTADFTAGQTLTAIPEPSSTLLLGLGTIGFALRRRR